MANTKKTKVEEEVRKVKIPNDYYIPVKANTVPLYYKSKKTGYEEKWDDTDIEIEMAYEELVSMRNSQKRFFTDNWITICNTEDYSAAEILKALNMDKYYVSKGLYDTIDDIFGWSAKKIEEVVPTLPVTVRDTLITNAYVLMDNNDSRLDSNAKRKALEKALNIKFEIEVN